MHTMLREILFPCARMSATSADWLLLALRLVIGTLMLVHGIQKIMGYETLVSTFPDPIGLGSRLSLQLAIFAEFFCSLGVITGLLFRLALVPLTFTMFVAAFVALGSAPWSQRELPVSYLLILLLLMVTGPGRISLDTVVCRWLNW